MTYVLTEADLPYLEEILDKLRMPADARAAFLRMIEVVPEETVTTTDHVEVDIGEHDHIEYLAKLVYDWATGDHATSGRVIIAPEHQVLPDQGGGMSGPGPGWGGGNVDIFMELFKSALEAKPSNKPAGKGKKQKVIHHPGKQWLDPGWYERR